MAGKLPQIQDVLDRLQALEDRRRRPPKRPRDEEPDEEPQGDKSGLQSRIRDLTRQRNQAEADLAEALEATRQLREAREAEMEAWKVQAAQQVSGAVARVQTSFSLRERMQDPDDAGVEAAWRIYETLPEGQRPKSLLDYWQTLEAEPAKAPRLLQPYIRPAAQDQEETPAQRGKAPPPRGKAPPRVDENRGRGRADPDVASMSVEQYEAWIQQQSMSRLRGA